MSRSPARGGGTTGGGTLSGAHGTGDDLISTSSEFPATSAASGPAAVATEGQEIKSARFRRERESSWRELERLIARVDGLGLRGLSGEETLRLPVLYRGALSSLSVARAISLDRALLGYLENLATRAFLCVYTRRRNPFEIMGRFLARDLPRNVRSLWPHLLLATLIFFGAVAIGWILVLGNPDRFTDIVSADMASGRTPQSSVEALRATIFGDGETHTGGLAAFSGFLFTHNARVSMMSFALGFALGVPTAILIAYNGLIIGAFCAVFSAKGLGTDFIGWLSIHGVTEVLAILLCGAAGLRLGQAIAAPGAYGWRAELSMQGRRLGQVVLGAVLLLIIAGLLEGFARQLVNETSTRYTIAFLTGALWLIYFGFAGTGPEESEDAA